MIGEVDMARLVKMVRYKEGFTAPYDAYVHPDEVAGFLAAGWTKVKPAPRKSAPRKSAAKKAAAAK